MKLFWMSWEQPGEDCRSVTFPPPEGVLAYWISGRSGDGSYTSLVALVRAESAQAAWEVVGAKEAWPDRGEERFIRVRDDAPSDRFPPPDWSIETKRWPWAVQP